MKRKYVLFAGGAAFLLVFLAACNFGSIMGSYQWAGTTGAVSLLPSRTMTVKGVNLSTYRYDAVVWTMAADYSPTDLRTAVNRGSSCGTSHHVCVYANSYARNVYGWASCRNGTSSGRDPNRSCFYQVVRFNLRSPLNSYPRVRLACHELGHTVGLRHAGENTSCVKRWVDGGRNQSLSSHDRRHINNHY